MNPRNRWNPIGETINPFEETETHPSQNYNSTTRYSTTEMHYPRYSLQPSRTVVATRDINDVSQNDHAWTHRSRFTDQTKRYGAAKTYRKFSPPNKDALAYHGTMYPPNYTDMWGYQ